MQLTPEEYAVAVDQTIEKLRAKQRELKKEIGKLGDDIFKLTIEKKRQLNGAG